MKATLTVLCAGLAFSWVAIAGAHAQPYRHASAALQAQSGYGQSGYGQSGSEQGKSSKKSKEVKLIGCLQQGSNPNEFVLTNATEEGQGMGTSGMQGQQMNMDFQLVPGRRVDLKKYVGQRVEVRGTVEPVNEGNQSSMSSQGTSGEASGMSGTQGTSGQSQSGQSGSMSGTESGRQQMSTGPVTHRVKVSSVKQLGSSCQ